ncbi:MAG: hypothetical protein SFV51_01045 [Bryobacteraceae bacterium]|nr:hypothetical protein [Bryobacteraceae bacterium]
MKKRYGLDAISYLTDILHEEHNGAAPSFKDPWWNDKAPAQNTREPEANRKKSRQPAKPAPQRIVPA